MGHLKGLTDQTRLKSVFQQLSVSVLYVRHIENLVTSRSYSCYPTFKNVFVRCQLKLQSLEGMRNNSFVNSLRTGVVQARILNNKNWYGYRMFSKFVVLYIVCCLIMKFLLIKSFNKPCMFLVLNDTCFPVQPSSYRFGFSFCQI